MSKFWLLPIFLLLAIAAVSEAACPDGWSTFYRSKGIYCMKFVNDHLITPVDAMKKCRAEGAPYLASFENEGEFKFAAQHFNGQFWIGGSRRPACIKSPLPAGCNKDNAFIYDDNFVSGRGYWNWYALMPDFSNAQSIYVYGQAKSYIMGNWVNGILFPTGYVCGKIDRYY